jgi:ABC-type amino acid transport substrate-binding protein
MFKNVVLVCICIVSIAFANAKEVLIGSAASGYEPLQYHDKDGKFVGYDVDFFNEVGKLLDVEVKWIHPKGPSNAILAVEENKADFAPGFVSTKERQKKVNFSEAYFQGNYSVFVAHKDSRVKKDSDLKNAKIAVVIGTFQSDLIDEKLPKAEKIYFDNNADVVLAIQKNKVDAGILPYSNAKKIIENEGKNKTTTLIGNKIPDTGARVVINKSKQDLLKKINGAIETLKKNGTQKRLHNKWYSNIQDFKYRKF